MNIDYIKTFYTVAQFKSFQKAADILIMTQSGVSRRIQQLEDELGVVLFNRTPQSVSLTKHGDFFRSYAARMLNVYDDCIQALQDVRQESIKVGMPHTLYGFLADAFTAFIQHSATPLVLHCANSQDVYEMLIDQTIDIGITSAIYPSPQIKYEEIYHEPLLCVATPQLARQYSDQEDAAKPFIFLWMHKFSAHPWEELYNTLSNHPHFTINVELNNLETARELALRHVGFTTLPYSEVKDHLACGKLAEVSIPNLKLPSRCAYIATYRQANHKSEQLAQLQLVLTQTAQALLHSQEADFPGAEPGSDPCYLFD